jgi:hypothetical protein
MSSTEPMPEPFYDVPQPSNVAVAAHSSTIDASTVKTEANGFPINPFFPPMNAAAPSPHKRRRTDPLVDHFELYARGNSLPRQDIFAEVEALANLEVLTTR